MQPAEYKFYHGKDVLTLDDYALMLEQGTITQEEYDSRYLLYSQVVEAEVSNERAWRNKEYNDTDWMLIRDATYDGEPLKGSPLLAEVLAYRQSLKQYDLRYDERPTKPSWMK